MKNKYNRKHSHFKNNPREITVNHIKNIPNQFGRGDGKVFRRTVMFKARLVEILIIVVLLFIVAGVITSGCAIDIRGKATVLDARIDDTAQTSLSSGRAARD
ncbi:MAG: hypothetical protein Q8N58_00695 [bacterium]|nr:hypothetical protein [bacterium]